MLSVTLEPVEGHPIGQHPLVVALMRGAFNSNPPAPKYGSTWNVGTLLDHLRRCPNEGTALKPLSHKLAALLSLATLLRSKELASIDRQSIQFSDSAVSFSLLDPRKAQRGGGLHTFSLKKLPDEPVDPVRCLGFYIAMTDPLRNETNHRRLFISVVRPHKPIGKSTLSNWIKSEMKAAGIDVSKFQAHSVRGAAASSAASKGVPIQSILQAGHWASESTFTRFYHREATCQSVAEAVLSS